MKPKMLFIVVLFLLSCSPIRGCMASAFTLAPESRLPKWLSLPAGYSRDAIIVKLYYYSSPLPVDDAVFELTDQNENILATVTGKMCWHPETNEKRKQHDGFDSDLGPYYVYVRTNGALEVLEHEKGQTFRISDDPKLVKEAIESKTCKRL